MTNCEMCGNTIVGEPPHSTRDGDFCGARCFEHFTGIAVPVFSDEQELVECGILGQKFPKREGLFF